VTTPNDLSRWGDELRAMPGFVALLVALLLSVASPAFAAHGGVMGEVRIVQANRDGTQTETITNGLAVVDCASTSCVVTVSLGGRDYSRFVRWCRSDRVTVHVPANAQIANVECPGQAGKFLRVYGSTIRNSSIPAPAPHEEPVNVTVVARR
jgi:hypothetical protein